MTKLLNLKIVKVNISCFLILLMLIITHTPFTKCQHLQTILNCFYKVSTTNPKKTVEEALSGENICPPEIVSESESKKLNEFFNGHLSDVRKFSEEEKNKIKYFFREENLKNFTEEEKEKIKNFFNEKFWDLRNFTEEEKTKLKGFFENANKNVQYYTKEEKNSIEDFFTGNVKALRKFTKRQKNKLYAFFTYEILKNLNKDLASKISNWIKNKSYDLKDFSNKELNNIKSVFVEKSSELETFSEEEKAKISNYFSQKTNQVKNFSDKEKEKIIRYFYSDDNKSIKNFTDEELAKIKEMFNSKEWDIETYSNELKNKLKDVYYETVREYYDIKDKEKNLIKDYFNEAQIKENKLEEYTEEEVNKFKNYFNEESAAFVAFSALTANKIKKFMSNKIWEINDITKEEKEQLYDFFSENNAKRLESFAKEEIDDILEYFSAKSSKVKSLTEEQQSKLSKIFEEKYNEFKNFTDEEINEIKTLLNKESKDWRLEELSSKLKYKLKLFYAKDNLKNFTKEEIAKIEKLFNNLDRKAVDLSEEAKKNLTEIFNKENLENYQKFSKEELTKIENFVKSKEFDLKRFSLEEKNKIKEYFDYMTNNNSYSNISSKYNFTKNEKSKIKSFFIKSVMSAYILNNLPAKFNSLPEVSKVQYDYNYFMPNYKIETEEQKCLDEDNNQTNKYCNFNGNCHLNHRGIAVCNCKEGLFGTRCEYNKEEIMKLLEKEKDSAYSISLVDSEKFSNSEFKSFANTVNKLSTLTYYDEIITSIILLKLQDVSQKIVYPDSYYKSFFKLMESLYNFYYRTRIVNNDLANKAEDQLRIIISSYLNTYIKKANGSSNIKFENSFFKIYVKSFNDSNKVEAVSKYVESYIKSNSKYNSYFDASDYLSSLNKDATSTLTVSFVVYLNVTDKFGKYNDSGLKLEEITESAIVDLKFYDKNNNLTIVDNNTNSNFVKVFIALNDNNKSINKYLTVNSNRFYDNTFTDEIRREYERRTKYPYLVDVTTGKINTEYSRAQRVNQMHKFVDLIYNSPLTPEINLPHQDDNVSFEKGFLLTKTNNINMPFNVIYAFNGSGLDKENRNYFYTHKEIFNNYDNWKRCTILFVLLITLIHTIMFLIYYCKDKTLKNANEIRAYIVQLHGEKVKDRELLVKNEVNIDQTIHNTEFSYKVKEINNLGEEVYKDTIVDYLNKSFGDVFCLNLKSGSKSSLYRDGRLYSPLYKEEGFCFNSVVMSIFYLSLFYYYYPKLNLYIDWKYNKSSIALIIFICVLLTNLTLYVLSMFYSCKENEKIALSTLNVNNDNDLEEIYIKNKKSSKIKSLVIMFLNYAVLTYLAYTLFGFVMVYKNYDRVFFASLLAVYFIDFIIFKLLWSFVIALGCNRISNPPNSLIRLMIAFTKMRSGA